jgi:hypothetical protein
MYAAVHERGRGAAAPRGERVDIGVPKRVIEIEPTTLPLPEPAPILEPSVDPIPAPAPDPTIAPEPAPVTEPAPDGR